MNKNKFKNVISDLIREHKLRKAIKSLVVESIEEIKNESKKSLDDSLSELDALVKKTNKDYSVQRNDANRYVLVGADPLHQFVIYHMFEDKFNIEYVKDKITRTKKLNMPFDELKKFIQEVLSSKDPNYVVGAHNKVAEQNKASKKEEAISAKVVKAEDMVKNEKDLPSAPYREVDKDNKKQVDHKNTREGVNYKYPKQKDNKLTIKLKSKKQKSSKK